jgi:large subunit ribosomal protein L25
MNAHKLTASVRTITGKKVKMLRVKELIPATLYGKGIKSISVECPLKPLTAIIREAGESGLVYLTVEDKVHPTLIHMVQRHPVTNDILHIEFHEVNLKESVKANVPVVLTGEALAVKDGVGTLLQITAEIEVEALPTNLPEKYEVDVTNLAAVNDEIQVKDIPAIPNVTILSEPTQIIVKVGGLVKPEPVEAPPVAEGEPVVEGEEGNPPAGGGGEGKEGVEEKEKKSPPTPIKSGPAGGEKKGESPKKPPEK